MRIKDCMKTDVVSIGPDRTVREAATLMVERHIGTLPIVDEQARLIGLLTIGDVLQLFMPDFVSLLSDLDFVPDFGRLEEHAISVEAAQQSVRAVMQAAISVERNSGLLRAFAEINRHNLLDLPIVDATDRLVGLASRTDIGTAFLGQWLGVKRVPRAAKSNGR
jgi:CBS-domain-containing membrane protein